jgi:hypothetical protein
MMELPDDLQKQLKQARKDAKGEEAEKDKKKGRSEVKGFSSLPSWQWFSWGSQWFWSRVWQFWRRRFFEGGS